MEIKHPITTPPAASNSNAGLSALKPDQKLEAKIVKMTQRGHTVTVLLAGKIISFQSSQPLNLSPGQFITFQAIKLDPPIELTIANQTDKQNPAGNTILKQIIQQPERTEHPLRINPDSQLQKAQVIQLKIVEISDKQLTGVMLSTPSAATQITTDPIQKLSIQFHQISGLSIDAKNSSGHRAGEVLSLEVIRTGPPPQFLLRKEISDEMEQRITAALKKYLPIQASSALLLTELNNTVPVAEDTGNIPQTLKRLAREILQSLPHRSQITSTETLKQHILNSGRFLETKLTQLSASPQLNIENDFKLKLSKLVDSLALAAESKTEIKPLIPAQEALKALLQKTRASLAGMIVDQLQSLPKEDGNKHMWLLELPFIHDQQIETTRLEIEWEQASGKTNAKKSWTVNMTVSPPQLGTIHCKLTSFDQVLSTRFWSERPDTVILIAKHLAYLKQQLEKNGIHSGSMDVQHGKPVSMDTSKAITQNLLNEKA